MPALSGWLAIRLKVGLAYEIIQEIRIGFIFVININSVENDALLVHRELLDATFQVNLWLLHSKIHAVSHVLHVDCLYSHHHVLNM